MKENQIKNLNLFITVVIIGIVVWFLIIFPLIKFKKMENDLLDATKRYFEISESRLPKGNKIKKISLDELYKKDFIKNDLKAPYTNKMCNSETSWGKVKNNNGEYEYSVYLECGIFKSKVDHKGPTINLKGEDETVIYLGQKYKEQGVLSVVDDTDGTIDVKNVKIDSSKVDTSKTGIYEVTYKVKDSLENETIKIRKIIVTQTLNNVVKKDTSNANTYVGNNDNNYIMLDEVLFKIVGINSDGTVKIVSEEPLGSVDYQGIDKWLNNYFYSKLSDSAKSLISQNSKWCIDKVDDPYSYKKCKKYSRKKAVGLLSIIDYSNAKDKDNNSNLANSKAVWTSNSTKNSKNYYVNSYYNNDGLQEYRESSEDEIFNVKPAVNIVKNATIVSGDGSNINPYILKGNQNKVKAGNKVSATRVGSYISYSGYNWRVIGKDEDDTTEVIITSSVSGNDGTYYTKYSDSINYYNPNTKNTLAYNIVNKITSSIKTTYFVKKNMKINNYNDKVLYNKVSSSKTYSLKLREVSVFDLFSPISTTNYSYWYQEIAKNKNIVYVDSPTIGVYQEKFDHSNEYSVRVVGFFNKNAVIKNGSGTLNDPYTITK